MAGITGVPDATWADATEQARAADVVLTERSTTALTPRSYRILRASERAQRLLQEGVLSFIQSARTPYGVRSGCYVGQAVLEDGSRLVIREKSEGALRSLVAAAAIDDIRSIDIPSAAATQSEILELFAERFLEYLGEYLRHGRKKVYRALHEQTSSPKGRIDFVRSFRTLARGNAFSLACRRHDLTADVIENRLLGRALLAIEMMAASKSISRRVGELGRNYSPLFADVDTCSAGRLSYRMLATAFQDVLNNAVINEDLQRAMMYGRAICLHLGAWPTDSQWLAIPHSFFVNLESLFENAVRANLKTASPFLAVSKGASLQSPVFKSLPERYIADPDIVFQSASGDVVLVSDCKYKILEGSPGHSDVYQLLAHCSALDCTFGALFYPDDQFEIRPIGITSAGVEIFAVTLRISSLEQDAKSVVSWITQRQEVAGQ